MTTTDTLNQIDWDRALEDSPRCENPNGCEREAKLRIHWSCGCMQMGCVPCVEVTVEMLAVALFAGHCRFACDICQQEIHAHQMSELMRVTRL